MCKGHYTSTFPYMTSQNIHCDKGLWSTTTTAIMFQITCLCSNDRNTTKTSGEPILCAKNYHDEGLWAALLVVCFLFLLQWWLYVDLLALRIDDSPDRQTLASPPPHHLSGSLDLAPQFHGFPKWQPLVALDNKVEIGNTGSINVHVNCPVSADGDKHN